MTDIRGGPENGFTLIEVLLALVILGTGIIVFVSGVGAAADESGLHRQDATLQTIVRNEAAALQAAAKACSGSLNPAYSAPAGYTVSASPLTCPTIGSPTQVAITASSTDGRAHDSPVGGFTVVVRAP